VVSDGAGGFRVALLADAAASQDVEILNFSKPPEALPATAQLPVEAAGLKPQAPPPPPVPVSPTAAAPAKPAPVKPAPPKPVVVAKPETAPADPAEDVDR
jgi:hypothetical protein